MIELSRRIFDPATRKVEHHLKAPLKKVSTADKFCVLQVAPESHWLELEVLILVVSSEKKAVSSTRGMQTTVKTSPLMKVC